MNNENAENIGSDDNASTVSAIENRVPPAPPQAVAQEQTNAPLYPPQQQEDVQDQPMPQNEQVIRLDAVGPSLKLNNSKYINNIY